MRTWLTLILACLGIGLLTGTPHCETVNGALGFLISGLACLAGACAVADPR